MSTPSSARANPAKPKRPVELDVLLGALPHPIIVVGDENRVTYANAAAEVFLSTSLAILKRD
jgi:two-component system, NtrC family, nitrogen regulation sensor histidine kinase GlnL